MLFVFMPFSSAASADPCFGPHVERKIGFNGKVSVLKLLVKMPFSVSFQVFSPQAVGSSILHQFKYCDKFYGERIYLLFLSF